MSRYTVFLGGTCNNSDWRERLIPKLNDAEIKWYNPVVRDWTPACQAEETYIKSQDSTVNLFVITSDMTGVYSIAEVVDSSHKKPSKTVFYFESEGFNNAQVKSLCAVGNLVRENGVLVVPPEASLNYVAEALRKHLELLEV